MGGSVFGIKEAFRTLSLVDEKSVVSTPGYKAMKVFIQDLVIQVWAFFVEQANLLRNELTNSELCK